MVDTQEVSVATKVAFLRRADSFPVATRAVDVVETHMSWVFLTDTRVYKLKKPVHRDFLDLRLLSARHRNCEQELLLNRRLAPDVYLGVRPLVMASSGALALAQPGRVVDWLVEMRRLPQDAMLDTAIRRGVVDPAALVAVAQLLSEFYRRAQPVEIAPAAYRGRHRSDVERSASVLRAPRTGLDHARLNGIISALQAHLETHASDFDARVAAGRIVEGHGDLRPEHVCLTSPPAIIDCLEFDRELRIVDAADELAYLALECECLGMAEIGDTVLAHYQAAAVDRPPQSLVAFHKAVRALLRARLCIWHLDDVAASAHAHWIDRAARYVALAAQHAAALGSAGGR